jgi:hypothetical protein
MKREERKEEKKALKTWKKPELKVLDKKRTESGSVFGETEDMWTYTSP